MAQSNLSNAYQMLKDTELHDALRQR